MSKYIKTTFMSLTLLLSSKIVAQDPQHKDHDQAPGNQNLLSQEDLNLIEQNQDRFHAYLSADLVDCLSQIKESKDMPKEVSNLKNYAKDHRIADCDFMSNAINQAIDYCKSSPENYKHVESLEEYKNYLEDGSAIITLDSVTRGHKCKKSKCFCRLRVVKEIRAGSLFTSGNASIKGALSAGSVSTTALTTSTINGEYPVTDPAESLRMIRGSIIMPAGLTAQVSITTTTPKGVPYYPFPYTITANFFINGTQVNSFTPIAIGKGFTPATFINNVNYYAFLDNSGSGVYPVINNFQYGSYYTDVITLGFIFPITFTKPFKSVPTVVANGRSVFVTGYSGTINTPGGVILTVAEFGVSDVTTTGCEFFMSFNFKCVGLEDSSLLPTIEANLNALLSESIVSGLTAGILGSKISFIAVGE